MPVKARPSATEKELDPSTEGRTLSVPALHAHKGDLTVVAAEVAEAVESRLAEERARWAMQIHDSLTQSVTSAVLELEAFRSRMATDPEGALAGLKEVQDAIRDDLERIREVLFRLTDGSLPATTKQATLAAIARTAAERWGVEARVHVEGDVGAVGSDAMDAALGIVHEAVTNAAKHSGSSDVVVHVDVGAGALRIDIEDHGRGIAGVADGVPHFGLRMMRARAEDIGGTIDIGSRPGEGTRILARLPLEGAR
jgi:two-component system NarL family sensor kinase